MNKTLKMWESSAPFVFSVGTSHFPYKKYESDLQAIFFLENHNHKKAKLFLVQASVSDQQKVQSCISVFNFCILLRFCLFLVLLQFCELPTYYRHVEVPTYDCSVAVPTYFCNVASAATLPWRELPQHRGAHE